MPPFSEASLMSTVCVFPCPPGAGKTQQENIRLLSWQSESPPPPSLQLLAPVPLGSFCRVIHPVGPASGSPPVIGASQTVLTPAGLVTEALISSEEPMPCAF